MKKKIINKLKYNYKIQEERIKGTNYHNRLLENKCTIEIKEIKKTRSNAQNRALHLFFNLIAEELNNIGLEFTYIGLNGNSFSLPHSPEIVKNFIWRPIQIALFDIESTTKINTQQINDIINVITKFFGDKGILIQFPNIDSVIAGYLE